MSAWRSDLSHVQTILVAAEEDPEIARLRAFLEAPGRSVLGVHSREEALNVLDSQPADVVITRLRGRRIRGLAILAVAQKRHPEMGAILLINPGEEDQATRAMRRGVVEFQCPPYNFEKIGRIVERILAHQRLTEDLSRLSQRLDRKFSFPDLIGNSGALSRLRSRLREIAPLDLRALISGEEGTGKDLVAGILHQNSPRRNAPFVRVDCSALPPRQLTRVLFGTPARSRRARREPGRIEIASEGTLYLDRVAQMPADLQARVCEVVRTSQLRPEIGALPIEVRPRVIASCETDLVEWVEGGRFHEGFYEVLSEVRIDLVPLRHRRRDIEPIARHLLNETAERQGKTLSLDRSALDRLADYDWPGNVRELKGVVDELAGRLASGTVVAAEELPAEIRDAQPREERAGLPLGLPLAEVEKRLIAETLRLCQGNRAKAAGVLGIGVRTLYRKIKAYGLVEKDVHP